MKDYPVEKGKSYFFRTVTFHILGKVVSFTGNFVKLQDASWIPDSGRFMNFIKEGKLDELSEVEPVGEVFVNLDSVSDFYLWKHDLPKSQK